MLIVAGTGECLLEIVPGVLLKRAAVVGLFPGLVC